MARLLVTALFCLCPGLAFAAWPGEGYDTQFDRSLFKAAFETVDWSAAREQVRLHFEGVSAEEADQLLQKNLRFIFFNKLNRSHFVVAPRPQAVVERMTRIFEISEQISDLIGQAGSLPAQSPAGLRARLLLSIVKASRDLKEEFDGFFMEGHSTVYSLSIPRERSMTVQWAAFLGQAQELDVQLKESLREYFLSPAPGAISLKQFRESSIKTLLDALAVLSESVRKRLDG